MTIQEILAAAKALALATPNTRTLAQLEAARDALQAELDEADEAQDWDEADAIAIQLHKTLIYIRHWS